MAGPRNYTAYCGLYCSDCNRSKSDLFELVAKLEQWLAVLKFEQYAAYKASTNAPQFAEYPAFLRVLNAIKELACVTCTNKVDSAGCQVRKCVLDKGIAGCWDCTSSASCDLLAPLLKAHPCLEHNHTCIRECGVDNWSDRRGKHYSWDER
jgi:hypothetical protein